MKQKIWLITGISSGLGQALAQSVMETGDFVIGTFRNQDQADDFNKVNTEKGFAVKLDITDAEEVSQVFQVVLDKFGKIDVLVNNAGFGFAGAVEEATLEEIKAVFEANFFGTLYVTQAVLPILRQQKAGHILQISSHSGFKGFAGFGIYSASKFAVEGLSEALVAEIEPLGIKLTIVEPGPSRTNFAGNSFKLAAKKIEDYKNTAGLFRDRIKQVDGKQEGDPKKAAEAIIKVVNSENPPLRLPLGKIALATLNAKLESVKKDMDNWAEVARNAVFD